MSERPTEVSPDMHQKREDDRTIRRQGSPLTDPFAEPKSLDRGVMRRRSVGLAALVIAGAFAVACGSSRRDGFGTNDTKDGDGPGAPGDGDFGEGTAGFTLEPANVVAVIDTATDPPTPATVTYRLTKATDGGTVDVTKEATFRVADDALGRFDDAVFTSVGNLPAGTLGSATQVAAEVKGGKGLGTLTVIQLRKTGPQRDFFFIVPQGKKPTPDKDVLTFSTNIKQADVVFAMDTTSSMGNAITNLKNAIAQSLLSSLQKAIPNVGLAVVDYRDYPYGNYGEPQQSDFPVKVRQTVTTVLADAQFAVGQYRAGGGGDVPEAQIPAMQHILTGEALTWPSGMVPAHTPAAGTSGGVDFRPGSIPILVNVTDATWHDDYSFAKAQNTPTFDSLKDAINARNAYFINLTSGDEKQANNLSDGTSSNVSPSAFGGACGAGKCCSGVNGGPREPDGPGGTCRLNFRHVNGSGVSDGIVSAVAAIAVGASFDVKAVPSNDPSNSDGVDATQFIASIRAMGEGDAASGCPAAPTRDTDGDGVDDTFVAVAAGTPVCFEVVPRENTAVAAGDAPKFYNAFIDVVGAPQNIPLDKRSVLFLVPPKDPGVK